MVEFLHWRIYSSCVYFIYPSLCSYKNWRVSLFISLLRSQYSGAELALANWNPRCCWYQSCVRGRRCSCVDRQPCRHTWFIAASFQWLQLAVGCSHHLIQPVLNATCVSVYRCTWQTSTTHSVPLMWPSSTETCLSTRLTSPFSPACPTWGFVPFLAEADGRLGAGDGRHAMLSRFCSYNRSLQYWRRPQVCQCSASAHESIWLSAGLHWGSVLRNIPAIPV